MRYEEKERNRIAEDILLDRRIRTSMYCAKCGYNLRSLPRAYHCPECGHEYSTRGTTHGIFLPHGVDPPIPLIVATLGSGLMAGFLIAGGIQVANENEIVLGCVFALITLGTGCMAVSRMAGFLNHRRIARRIEEDED